MSEDIGTNVSWTDTLEDYFRITGEKSHSMSVMHKQCEALYSNRKTFIDLPVIIGSAIIAFLNAGSTSLFQEKQQIASITLGTASLCMSILNSVGTYFSWAKRAESHRISALQYAQLYRFLKIELSLPREERMSPHDLLKYTQNSYDRLQEIQPLLNRSIIDQFKKKFNTKQYEDIAKPEETNGLERITVYGGKVHL